jgi:hypothetical protein
MHFLATVIGFLALAISTTFARLPLPEGYHIVYVVDLGENAAKASLNDTYAPLLNATLECITHRKAL